MGVHERRGRRALPRRVLAVLGRARGEVASAAVAPDTVEQVQAIVRIANRYKIPLYTISTGRNLGYGGSAPACPGSVVLDLEAHEPHPRGQRAATRPRSSSPASSYFDLYRYIQEHKLKVWIDCPDPGWGSVIGNALDHGGGCTPTASTATTSTRTAAWKSCSRTASCCAPAWARCRTRRRGSSTSTARGRRSTACSRSRTSAS